MIGNIFHCETSFRKSSSIFNEKQLPYDTIIIFIVLKRSKNVTVHYDDNRGAKRGGEETLINRKVFQNTENTNEERFSLLLQ